MSFVTVSAAWPGYDRGMVLPRVALALAVLGAACVGEPPGFLGEDGGAGAPDARPDGVAPDDLVPGAILAGDGVNPVAVAGAGEAIFRVDAAAGEHVAFRLDFAGDVPGVVLAVDRFDGEAPVFLAETDAGPGLRVLAVLDPDGPRTFFARVRAEADLDATLSVTRTPFPEGATCSADCALLLQLPLPNDPAADGYDLGSGTVYRYLFGRRDLVMFVRHAGRAVAAAGMEPFLVGDLSQWDGLTPGEDVGAPRHASHQRGKDVDLTLYGSDGLAPWRSYCEIVNGGEGRECVPGTMHDFDGERSARALGAIYASGRVTMCFLDEELIPYEIDGSVALGDAGALDAAIVELFADGTHLQHWPNHDNHVHVRVSETEYARIGGAPPPPEPFAAP